MNNIAPKLQKCWTHKIAFKIVSKMVKQPNFFQSWPSTLPKDTPAKFYLSTTFGLRLMISSVAPTRLSAFYAYLITKIGNRNLKCLIANRRKVKRDSLINEKVFCRRLFCLGRLIQGRDTTACQQSFDFRMPYEILNAP